MVKDHKRVELERVACGVCLKEVPKSEAMHPEVKEYILYFCGLDCYEKWKNTKPKRRRN